LKISLSTGSLYHFPLSRIFVLARELGFDGVELVLGPESLVRGPGFVRQLSQRHGVPVLSLHPPIMRLPGWGRESGLPGKIAAWAGEMGVPVVSLHTPRAPSLECHQGQRYLWEVENAAKTLRDQGVQLALENRARFFPNEEAQALDGVEELVAFVSERDLAITWDTAHAASMGIDNLKALVQVLPYLRNVHLSDFRHLPRWLDLPQCHTILKHHQMPGNGHLPLRECLRALSTWGYCQLLTLELSPVAIQAWNVSRIKDNLGKSLEFVRSSVA